MPPPKQAIPLNRQCLANGQGSAKLHIWQSFFALHKIRGRAYVAKQAGRPPARLFPNGAPMKIFRNARNWYATRRTMSELQGLSNETLNDIGITRYDIRLIATRFTR